MLGKSLLFPQQLLGKVHVETWAGGVSEPQPGDFPGTGDRGKVCCGGVPSSDSVCHSCNYTGSGSDIRMKMDVDKYD